MSARLDKALAALDAGLQRSDETGLGLPEPDRCVRCWHQPAKTDSAWCARCHPAAAGPALTVELPVDVDPFLEEMARLRRQFINVFSNVEWTWTPPVARLDDDWDEPIP